MKEYVTLVDQNDRTIGSAEKLEAHQRGLLHRAFSVFIFDQYGRLLLQKRASEKYHSACLWTNTCCGHPRPGEALRGAAARRLFEEMGFGCELRSLFSFQYRTEFDDGLIEHELDHVLVGRHDGNPQPDPTEVEDYQWLSTTELAERICLEPERYSYWFREVHERVASGAPRALAQLEEEAQPWGLRNVSE